MLLIATMNFDKIKLRFEAADESSKRRISESGYKSLLDLTLKVRILLFHIQFRLIDLFFLSGFQAMVKCVRIFGGEMVNNSQLGRKHPHFLLLWERATESQHDINFFLNNNKGIPLFPSRDFNAIRNGC